MNKFDQVKGFKKSTTYTKQPCVFCFEGFMELWRNENGNIVFYCYGNYNCRYSFEYDPVTKEVSDIDAFGSTKFLSKICKLYAEKVDLIEVTGDFEFRTDVWKAHRKLVEKKQWTQKDMEEFLGLTPEDFE